MYGHLLVSPVGLHHLSGSSVYFRKYNTGKSTKLCNNNQMKKCTYLSCSMFDEKDDRERVRKGPQCRDRG